MERYIYLRNSTRTFVKQQLNLATIFFQLMNRNKLFLGKILEFSMWSMTYCDKHWTNNKDSAKCTIITVHFFYIILNIFNF